MIVRITDGVLQICTRRMKVGITVGRRFAWPLRYTSTGVMDAIDVAWVSIGIVDVARYPNTERAL
jgi:hypothetical protein